MVAVKKVVVLLLCITYLHANGQIADGSTAPDFTLTDYYGTTHNLYQYLNAGKTVFVEIFAAHCPTCWAYHQTNRLKDMYNMYGPAGTDEIMILALEHDQGNDHNAFIGNGDPWVTQGNWLENTPFPVFDVEDPNRGVFTDYHVTYYPVIYKICPDKIVERVLTSQTITELYMKVQDCQMVSISEEEENSRNIYIDQHSENLVIDNYGKINALAIIDLSGRVVKTIHTFTDNHIDVSGLAAGVYLFELKTEAGPVVKKLYLN